MGVIEKTVNRAWAAGFFDGEGSVIVSRARYGLLHSLHHSLAVTISQKDQTPLCWFRTHWGGYLQQSKRTGVWLWVVRARLAAQFLHDILPHVCCDRPRVQLALEFQARKHPNNRPVSEDELAIREAYKQAISALAKRNR